MRPGCSSYAVLRGISFFYTAALPFPRHAPPAGLTQHLLPPGRGQVSQIVLANGLYPALIARRTLYLAPIKLTLADPPRLPGPSPARSSP